MARPRGLQYSKYNHVFSVIMMILVVAVVVWAVIRAIITDKVGLGMFGIIGIGIFILAICAVIFHYSGKPEHSP